MIDMALGMAQMLGFKLSENFDYPYISKSVTEFWRRWHITLGAWFRDYVFIPLQFRVRKIKGFPIQLITVLVFLLTGLWHGFDEHFIAWGLMLGIVIAIENTKFGKKISQAWEPLQYIWTLGWISFSWLVFRAPDLDFVYRYLRNLIGLQGEIQVLPFSQTKPYPIFENSVFIAALFGILFAIPVYPWLKGKIKDFVLKHQKWYWVAVLADSLLLLLLLIFCIGMIVYNGPLPGVYDKF
jgi:alginate O-acetyltransferase complex protein AlgI